MSKIAFLFPGQGSQFAGMGKSLVERWPVAARVFEEADEALGFKLSSLCFDGPEDQLKLTENTQPALLTVSTAAFAVLREQGVSPDMVAGHSLGEYSALVAAAALSFFEAVRLVRHRGRYMQEAVPQGVGAMAALLRLPAEKLDEVLAAAAAGEIVSAANLNSPDQIVIAGHTGAVQRAIELAKAAGARKAILLPVSAPFHCALMVPAQQRLAADLNATTFRDLSVPMVNNWQAVPVQTAADAREGLYQQVPNPVRWTESVRRLAALGAERFLEVGAGGVLTGLLRAIEPEKRGARFGEAAEWEKLSQFLAA
jgi:[acyl-carrier-protein] S-malonyltransferase